MRLHRHDEIVETMANAVWNSPTAIQKAGIKMALDAMLEAVVKLDVGKTGEGWAKPSGKWGADETETTVPDVTFPVLILKVQKKKKPRHLSAGASRQQGGTSNTGEDAT